MHFSFLRIAMAAMSVLLLSDVAFPASGMGPAIPSTCVIGDSWFVPGPPARAFDCTGTNTWAARGGAILAGVKSVSVNAANTDVATISMPAQRFIVRKVLMTGASVNFTGSSATVGIWSGAGGTGTNLIAAGSVAALSTSARFIENLPGVSNTSVISQVFVRCVVAHGSAATIEVYIFGDILP